MIVLNELEFAQQMDKHGFLKVFSIYELSIYAKWLKYLGKSHDEIENRLIEFSEKNYEYFNYQIHFDEINKALKSIDEYNLRIPCDTIVTKSEWESICSTDNEKYRRVLFVMLVLSKYYKNNNTKINKKSGSDRKKEIYPCWFSDLDICKTANVSFRPVSERDAMFAVFRDLGLVDIVSKNITYRYLKFVNENSEPLIEVSDYDNIIWYYEKQIGGNFGECKECGKLFKQNKVNNAKYCKKHRRYEKNGTKTIVCVDCGKEFEVNSKSNKQKRCNDCYKIYRKNNVKKAVANHRIKNM